MHDYAAHREDFTKAWVAVGADPSRAPDAWQELISRYNEPFRYYHRLHHVEHCLKEFDAVRRRAAHPERIELAIWFHDAVYEARRRDNEHKSAGLAREFLSSAGADPEAVSQVGSLICSTKTHDPSLEGDEAIMSDVDLAILGAPAPLFRRYEEAVRFEYGFVPGFFFWPLRRRFARRLLARDRIFHTRELYDRYELQARKNLRESASLWNRLWLFVRGLFSFSRRGHEVFDWFSVRFDAQRVYLEASPPGRVRWSQAFAWADVVRICFCAEGLDASDGIYVFTSRREASYAFPAEAKGGMELWYEILRRDLFSNELAIKAAGAVGGKLFCWPEE